MTEEFIAEHAPQGCRGKRAKELAEEAEAPA